MPEAPSPRRPPTWRGLLSPTFLACVVIVAAAAGGLRPAMHAIAARYEKHSIPLRRPLEEFNPAAFKSFDATVVAQIENMPSVEDVGTEHVLMVDLKPLDSDRARRFFAWMLVTYYSDPHDQVPHTPEVCYRQAGTRVGDIAVIPVDVPRPDGTPETVDVRAVDMHQPQARLMIAYVFHANGTFCHDREQVRWVVGRPGDRYVYFSKIEAIAAFTHEFERQEAIELCRDILREGLPALVADHYPRPEDLR